MEKSSWKTCVVSQFSHKNAAISIMYNQLYIIILLALSLTTPSDSGGSSIPLGHRPGSDQPWSGRLEDGVCCKTRNTQLLKVTTQMKCPSLCISWCFIKWKLWEYQWQPGTDWVTTMKKNRGGEGLQPKPLLPRRITKSYRLRWNLLGGFNPSRQSEKFLPSSNDDAPHRKSPTSGQMKEEPGNQLCLEPPSVANTSCNIYSNVAWHRPDWWRGFTYAIHTRHVWVDLRCWSG